MPGTSTLFSNLCWPVEHGQQTCFRDCGEPTGVRLGPRVGVFPVVSPSHPFPIASKRDCLERFGPRTLERITQDDDVICTTEYSRIVPLENGEVRVPSHTVWAWWVPEATLDLTCCAPSADCSVLGERAPRGHEFLLLTSTSRLHQGHQHPPAVPANQHTPGSPYGQGAAGPHRHPQGELGNVVER